MSRLYNDRYVKNHKSERPVDYYQARSHGAGNAKIVETVVCIFIGSVVFYTMCAMVLAAIKPLMTAFESIQQEQIAQAEIYDTALSMGDLEVLIDD